MERDFKFKTRMIVDTIIGLRNDQKLWLKRHRELTGKSNSKLVRELIDKEIKRQDLSEKRRKGKD